MKKVLFFAIISSLLWSCENGMVVFYVNDTSETTIEGQFPVNLSFNIPIPKITSNNTQEFENNNTAPELIKEVNLEQLTLTILSPTDEDFSFLESMTISIKKDDNDTDPKVLAYIENINSTAKTIDLVTTDENLVEYLKEESYQLVTKATVKEYLTHDVDVQIDLKFKVKADVL